MEIIAISHIYNESFLLPYWIKHHLRLFDHCIFLDYDSTDNSLEIIRKLAPNWEVRKSRNKYFSAIDCDKEVMAIEEEIIGWKMTLNTTEFLFHYDLKGLIKDFEKTNPDKDGIKTKSFAMVDKLDERGDALLCSDLFLQKFYGCLFPMKQRLLHKRKSGRYEIGRHHWEDEHLTPQFNLLLLWFGWCPMDFVMKRKLQIKQKIPDADRIAGFGHHHFHTEEQMENEWKELADKHCQYLTDFPDYKEILMKIHDKFNLSFGQREFPP